MSRVSGAESAGKSRSFPHGYEEIDLKLRKTDECINKVCEILLWIETGGKITVGFYV